MKVVGFSFIRNALKYDYPIKEAILSVLPICDEFVVAVGNSEDDTLALLGSIGSPKIKIIHTVWDDSLRQGGKVLAVETNKAFDAVPPDADWAIYIQGDEVIHEQYLPTIRNAMQTHLHSPKVEGLLLHYLHFYGSYQYVGDSRDWYRHEIRVIRNNKNIRSYKDAQGFRKTDGSKLNVKLVEACVYHYGWVKPPDIQQLKAKEFNKLWHSDQEVAQRVPDVELYDYSQIDSLKLFEGSHPAVMTDRLKRLNWNFHFDISKKKWTLRKRFAHWIEQKTGWRIGEYKNYKLV